MFVDYRYRNHHDALQLNNRIAAMQSFVAGDYGPTDQDVQAFAQISTELDEQLSKLTQALAVDLLSFNLQLKAAGLSPVAVAAESKTGGIN